LQPAVVELLTPAVRQELEGGGHREGRIRLDLAEQRQQAALRHGEPFDQGAHRLHRALVGRAHQNQLVDVGGAGPGHLRPRPLKHVGPAVHQVVAGDQPAHAVRDHVETQVGAAEPLLEAGDLLGEQLGRLGVVAPPVVGEEVEGVAVAARRRVVDAASLVTRVVGKRCR
jgi:hypothetical protein